MEQREPVLLPSGINIDTCPRAFGCPLPFDAEGEPYGIGELLSWSAMVESQVRENLLLEQMGLLIAEDPELDRRKAETSVTSVFPISAATAAILDTGFFNPLLLTNGSKRYLGVLGLMGNGIDMTRLSFQDVGKVLSYLNSFAPSGYRFVLHMPAPTEEEIERGWSLSIPTYRTVHLYLVENQLP